MAMCGICRSLTTEQWSCIRLMSAKGVGATTFWRLLKKFGSAEAVCKAKRSEIISERTNADTATAIVSSHKNFKTAKYREVMDNFGFSAIFAGEKDYPKRLEEMPHPPPVLWVKGKTDWLNTFPQVAVVGTRDMNAYGREVTQQFVSAFVSVGVTIVSGLAFGVDTCAHLSALSCEDGKTIGVLGGGMISQLTRKDQGFRRVEDEAVLISQFDPFVSADKTTFPQRNNVMAAMADAVVVTQAGEDSGALITAKCAAKLNRKVFVVPGDIDSERSKGCNNLISSGKAKLIVDADAVLKAVFPSFRTTECSVFQDKNKSEKSALDSRENSLSSRIVKAISKSAKALDEIVAELESVSTSEILSELGMLEISGQVKNIDGKYTLSE